MARVPDTGQSRPGGPRLPRRVSLFAALGWLCLLCAQPSTALAELEVEMTADRNEISLGERLTVIVQVSQDGLERPDITLPEFHGFRILHQSVQRPTHFSFGLSGQQVRSSAIYKFVLEPMQPGKFVIDPVVANLGKARIRSAALTVIVRRAAQPGGVGRTSPQPNGQPSHGANDTPTANGSDAALGKAEVEKTADYIHAQEVDAQAFIRTVIDKAEPYEREQVTVTLYLYTRDRLQVAPTIDREASTDGFWTQDLLDGKALEQLPVQRVGRSRYHVYLLRRMAAFPLRSGDLTVGAMSLTINQRRSVFGLFAGGSPSQSFKRTGVPITLHVKPLPAKGRPRGDAAVGHYTLEAGLDRTQTATGDAVTLTATIEGQGYIQSINLVDPTLPGLTVLEPQVKNLVEISGDQVGGTRVFEWLVVPQEPGAYTLPPLKIHTFDPETQQYAVLQGPELTLTAAGRGMVDVSQAPPPTPGDQAAPAEAEQAHRFGPVRTRSSLLRSTEHVHDNPLFPLALLLPPLAFAALFMRDYLGQRARAQGGSGSEQAQKRARVHMRAAEAAAKDGDSQRFHAELANGLQRALESRLEEPVGGYTRDELRKRVAASGMEPELVRTLLSQLERCDMERFSPMPGISDNLLAAMQEANRVYERVLLFTPSQPRGAA